MKRKLFFSGLFLLILILACSDTTEVQDEISIAPQNLVFERPADSDTLVIDATTSWTVNIGEPWISVEPEAGSGDATVIISVETNDTNSVRETTITFTAGEADVHLDISQYFDFAGGSGTESEPFEIATPIHLKNIQLYLDAHFVQIADLDLKVFPWVTSPGWIPIGFQFPFSGSYDGNGYLITNMMIDRPDDEHIGLFGHIDQALLQNIRLVHADVKGEQFVGGLVGKAEDSLIEHCFVTGSINGEAQVGGIAGISFNTQILSSYTKADVGGISQTGGVVGRNSEGSIIKDVFVTGLIGGNMQTGGICGENYQSEVKNSFATGWVAGYVETGGLIGYNNAGAVTKSYWNTETTNQQFSSGGGVGKTTEDMTYPYAGDAYENWDFNNIWQEDSEYQMNQGYPYLRFFSR